MKLDKDQKEALITWLSEDLSLEEISKRGSAFEPPFQVTRGRRDYYKKQNGEEILELQETNGSDLTPRQILFCEHFMQTFNGTLSSKRAEYKGDNDNIHAVNASRLLKQDKIRKYISKRYKDVAMDTDEVLALLAKLARASASEYIKEFGSIDWDKVKDDGYAIAGVTHTKGQQSKIVLESRLKALELIGKSQAMFTDKMALTDPTGTKEYGADARAAILGKLLPELANSD